MNYDVRRVAGTPMTDEEHAELKDLSAMPESAIDFTDIPERTSSSASEALPLEEHTVTLKVDADVAAWLDGAGKQDASRINFALKREAERSRLRAHLDASLDMQKAS